ncbi:MAG: PSD1 and planctomycete cytochrome C domain-containing protein [Verrucomicrobiota bacterium]
MPFRPALFVVLLAPLLGLAAETTPSPTAAQVEFFEKEIRPVLVDNCIKCHGPKKQKSGLRLDSRELILKGGEVGPAVVSGRPELSRLILAINHAKTKDVEPMPNADEKIPDKAIAALTEWVRQGLPWPTEVSPIANDPRNHWAFQPVKTPPTPAVKASGRVRQPIDQFVLAKLEASGLTLAPDTSREVLARRLYLALVGYNPSDAEIATFVADKDPAATEKLVDRLMSDTAFGERWARHWLDVARYSDTKGYVFVEERRYPYAYTYRDWVVNAFNKDLAYDQFLRLQIAADQIAKDPENNRDLAALGFLTLGRRFLNNTPDIIDDRIDVVMRGTQGLTMACARCHDHKFDPLPTAEYYSLYSIFNSSEEPKQPPALKPFTRTKETEEFEAELAVRQKKHDEFVASRRENSFTAAKTADYLTLLLRAVKEPGFNFTQEAKRTNLYPTILTGWQRVLKPKLTVNDLIWGGWFQLKDLTDEQFVAKYSALLAKPDMFKDPLLRAELLKKAPKKFSDLTAAYATVLAAAHKLDKTSAENKPWRDLIEDPQGPTSITAESLIPGYNVADRNTRSKLEIAVVGFKATSPKSPPHAMVMNDKAKPVQGFIFLRGSATRPGKTVPRQFLAILSDGKPQEFKNGSGRLEFADAIASKTNPLTARVMVNRIWNELVGQPLVETPSDFGVRTLPPKNPELLDHLASTFMAQNWSMKKLIREIVLSSTFQQSSDFNAAAFAKDPENNLNWKANRRRLDFEAMRDSMLRVAGRLDAKIGGQPFDLIADFATPRRTIYGFIDRQNLPAVFRTFDFANPDYHVPKRNQTTTPQQSLWMLNHPFGRTLADSLAVKALVQPTGEDKIKALYLAILGREPKKDEITLALEYLRDAELAPSPATWTNGYGGWNPQTKTVAFTEMKVQTKDRISPTDKMPDKEFAHTFLTAKGGHPGDSAQATAVIRRWTAGSAGTYRIDGTLTVSSKASDGVRARIITARRGILAEAVTKGASSSPVALKEVELAGGESIDFIADNFLGSNSDSFSWSPEIKDAKTGEVISSAASEFGKKPDRQSALSTLAQILLQSNEFIFAD